MRIARVKKAKNITALRKKPGMSNAGKYKNVSKDDFAGPDGTFPINTKARARNALARAAQTKDPALEKRVRSKVLKKYPSIDQSTDKKATHKNMMKARKKIGM